MQRGAPKLELVDGTSDKPQDLEGLLFGQGVVSIPLSNNSAPFGVLQAVVAGDAVDLQSNVDLAVGVSHFVVAALVEIQSQAPAVARERLNARCLSVMSHFETCWPSCVEAELPLHAGRALGEACAREMMQVDQVRCVARDPSAGYLDLPDPSERDPEGLAADKVVTQVVEVKTAAWGPKMLTFPVKSGDGIVTGVLQVGRRSIRPRDERTVGDWRMLLPGEDPDFQDQDFKCLALLVGSLGNGLATLLFQQLNRRAMASADGLNSLLAAAVGIQTRQDPSKPEEEAPAVVQGKPAAEGAVPEKTALGVGGTKLNRLVAAILAQAPLVFNCDRATLYVVDKYNEELIGITESFEFRVPAGHGIAGHCVSNNETVNIQDTKKDPRWSASMDDKLGYQTKSMLTSPVVTVGGRVIAALQLMNKNDGGAFGDRDLDILALFSQSTGTVLHKLIMGDVGNVLVADSRMAESSKAFVTQFFAEIANKELQVTMKPAAEKVLNLVKAALSLGMLKKTQTEAVVPEAHLPAGFSPEDMAGMELNFLELSNGEMRDMIEWVFVSTGSTAAFSIPLPVLKGFLEAIEAAYTKNGVAYHNFQHCFQVFHGIYYMSHAPLLGSIFKSEPLLWLALMVGALGHDTEHPGQSNSFLVASSHELAIMYNDQSVLENHHAATTFRLLRDTATEIFPGQMGADKKKMFRKTVITTILATDLSRSSNVVQELQLMADERVEEHVEEWVHQLLPALLHAADTDHPTRPWVVHSAMSLRIAEEFFAQSQQEAELGLPSLQFMSVPPVMEQIAPMQVSFLQFVSVPLWDGVNQVVNGAFQERLDQIQVNKAHWQAQEQAAIAAAAAPAEEETAEAATA